jgi:hypothetical protein
MRSRRVAAAAVLLLALATACAHRLPYVPVREARFRTEAGSNDRIQLPLTAPGREKLLRYLRAGGDTDRIGNTAVDPNAESHYGPLLDLLADPSHLALEDATVKSTFRKWLAGPVVRQVIDAREESSPAIDPVAIGDGKYWWIFYPRDRKLAQLLVTLSVSPPRPQH